MCEKAEHPTKIVCEVNLGYWEWNANTSNVISSFVLLIFFFPGADLFCSQFTCSLSFLLLQVCRCHFLFKHISMHFFSIFGLASVVIFIELTVFFPFVRSDISSIQYRFGVSLADAIEYDTVVVSVALPANKSLLFYFVATGYSHFANGFSFSV